MRRRYFDRSLRLGSILFVAVLVSLLCSVALAAAATTTLVSSEVVVDDIMPDEIAEFDISITNIGDESQTYTLYTFVSGGLNLDPSPASDRVIENLAPGETYETGVTVNVVDDLKPGIYYVTLYIDSDLGDTYELPLKIYLGSDEYTQYLPSFLVDVDMDRELEPGDVQEVRLTIENRNPLDLSNMTLEVDSELFGFNSDLVVALPPLETKTLSFTATVDPFEQPKEYYVFFRFMQGEELVKVVEEKVEVVSVASPFSYEVTEETVYLKKYQTFVLENDGNVENSQAFLYPVHPLSTLFLNTDAKVVGLDGKQYLSWDVSLAPGESTSVSVVYNYRLLLYLALFVFLFVLFYLLVRSPVLLHKAAVTSTGKEGALHEIKIALEVKNRSKKVVKHLKVMDFIPGIADLDKRLELGTLKPDKVVSGKKGTKVIWKIAELDPLEHRIITYKVRTKLNVLGTFKLPRAEAEFSKKPGKHKKAYSNILRLDASKIAER